MPFTSGFNLQEAEDLIAMLSALEGTTPPPLQQPPLPGNWSIVFDSQPIGPFDNRWQLAQSTGPTPDYAILIRGTTYSIGSILDDLLAVMVPANGSISMEVGGVDLGINYQFAAAGAIATNPEAGVHLGFALSVLLLMLYPEEGILWQLPQLVPAGSSVFVAGHSQGASVATLATSFLHYGSNWTYFQNAFGYNYGANTCKTYVFSQPKPGNDIYGYDYDSITSNAGMGFTVTNTQDWVPQLPLTFELPDDVNKPNPVSVLGGAAMLLHSLDVLRLTERAAAVHAVKHAGQLQALSNVLADPRVQRVIVPGRAPLAGAATPGAVLPPVLFTLNFAGCGSPYILPGITGQNPCDAMDFFWQHHGAMYYDLIAGIPVPTTCP